MDAVRDKYKGKIDFELLDITKPENDKVASKYRVYLTPTFVITDSKDKEIDRLIGEVPRKTLETFIDKNLAKQKGGEEK